MSFSPRVLVLLLLAPLLAACPKLPQPFEHDQANPLLLLDGQAGVFFDFDADAPQALVPAMKAALMKQDIPVFLDKPPAEAFRLRLKSKRGLERGATSELELFWELLDQEGLAIGHYDQKARLLTSEWSAGSPQLMKRLAEEAAPALAALMPVEEGTKPTATQANTERPKLFIAPIEGAPGDGNEALLRAMRLSLLANGIDIVDKDEAASHKLKGLVKLSRADAKGDQLHVEWTLADPKGGEMASLDQQGMVPKGLLDKPWGTLAAEIVAGTAIELSALLKDAAKP